jgi:hypothetical protein
VPVFVERRITIDKRGRFTRPYRCADCGYRATATIHAVGWGQANGSIVAPKHQLETEARERADASLSDDAQHLFELVPCPRCGKRSDDASLYHQNTVLLMVACILAGAGFGVYEYLLTTTDRGGGSAVPLVVLTLGGLVAALVLRHQRNERITRAVRAVEFLPE